MLRTVLTLVLFIATGLSAAAQQSPGSPFSQKFKSSIDNAMRNQHSGARTSALISAMSQATNQEVFFVLPLLFPANMLNAATNASVCTNEISASTDNLAAFQASTNPKSFPDEKAAKIRADTDKLIRCLGKYYNNGQLRFPQAK
ncbi:hypothetical protein [Rhodanobacter sp. L36]|uniref:hypothetical protein n=1 Tax=Rhodanobacter sp. L36 TaxID=1747221 RepID=UPI00131CBBD5|nr:hypothetical protein [Rhodanobacter sp. L36]